MTVAVPVWQIVEARVIAAELAIVAVQANWVGQVEADPGVEAVLLKALIAAAARRGARASVAARADQALVEAVAVDPVAVVVDPAAAVVAEDAGRTIKAWQDGILEKMG